MAQFTERQLQELETLYGLQRIETLPVRDGQVSRTSKVWWRSEEGPDYVSAADHWANIRDYPGLYQLTKPHIQITYKD